MTLSADCSASQFGAPLRHLEELAVSATGENLWCGSPRSTAVAVDVEIGEGGAVRRMKQFGRLCEVDQDVGLRRPAPGRPAVSPERWRCRAPSHGSPLSSTAPAGLRTWTGPPSLAQQAVPAPRARKGRRDRSRSSRRAPPAGLEGPRPRRWWRRPDGARSRRVLLDAGRAACEQIIEIHSLRRASNPDTAALAPPPPSAVSCRCLAGFVAIGQHDYRGGTACGKSRVRRPEVESAAQAGRKVACMAAKQVSMPSPTITTAPGAASRTAPPRRRTQHYFLRFNRSFGSRFIVEERAVNRDRRALDTGGHEGNHCGPYAA